MPTKSSESKGAGKGLAALVTPDADLAAVVGQDRMPRTEVTKRIWGYIREHGLQDQQNKRMINADDKLKAVFGGKGQVNMFQMTAMVAKHVK